MPSSIEQQIEQIRTSIAALEAQRGLLGDQVVDASQSALREKLIALEAQAQAASQPTEERRLITIFFSDIVGSTSLAEKMDPEEWRRIVGRLHSSVGSILSKHGGQVIQYLGDGLLGFFGAQQASERDPENAIRAALEAQGEIGNWKLEVGNIQTRIGIHTGLVVVGELGSEAKKEFTATGDAMNLAARLQSAAPPGGILISHDTYRHVRGVFDVTPQPPLTLKGKAEPVQTYLVRRAKPRPFRIVNRGVVGIETRTVGREHEFKALQVSYLDAFENRGVTWAQLIGEVGVGKSRLLRDLGEWLELRPETFWMLQARAFEGDDGQPYALVRRLWFDRFQIAEDAPLPQAEAKWVQRFQELAGNEDVEAAHALGLLVGLPFNDSPFIGAMRKDPSQVKGRGFVVSRNLLERLRAQMPVVLLLEDLQWADGGSWEWLTQVVLDERRQENESGARNGLFVLGTSRDDWTPPRTLVESPGFRELQLARLSDQASRELARELLRQVQGVPDEVIALLVERSEGVPYFTEELVNWFVDRGIVDKTREPWQFVPSKLGETPLPATIQHLLFTRLSALSDAERMTLQRAAIFGRNFWSGGLEALGARESNSILCHLSPRGLVEQLPESTFEGEEEWRFHHHLLRDVNYESVLKKERAVLHQAAARWLEEQAHQAGRLDEFAGLIAEHAERAGDLLGAADWCLRAGESATRQGATQAAERAFSRALELLPPVERERRWRGLAGREQILGVLGVPERWLADVDALLQVATELGDSNRIAEAHYRRACYWAKTGKRERTQQASEEAITAAQSARNVPLELEAVTMRAKALVVGGHHEAALHDAEEALARARELGDSFTLALVLDGAAYCFAYAGNVARELGLDLEQVELDRRLGNRYQELIALTNAGAAYCSLGLFKQARAFCEQGVRESEALGARRPRAYNLGNLGRLALMTGDYLQARRLIEESLNEVASTGDVLGQAHELLQLGQVYLLLEDPIAAGKRFSAAQEIFASIGAAPAEHQAIAGRARAALGQGHLDQARLWITQSANYLQEHGLAGLFQPMWVCVTLAEVFDALGERERADEAVRMGYRWLMEIAHTIPVAEWRQSFLRNEPFNRAITDLWERLEPSLVPLVKKES